MNNEEAMRRDKLENIARLVDELLIEMDEDIEESDEEPKKRIRGLGYVGEKPANQGTRWNTDQDEHLQLMLAAGWPMKKVASRLKRTERSVEQRRDTIERMAAK